jgi:hypothetical protein
MLQSLFLLDTGGNMNIISKSKKIQTDNITVKN